MRQSRVFLAAATVGLHAGGCALDASTSGTEAASEERAQPPWMHDVRHAPRAPATTGEDSAAGPERTPLTDASGSVVTGVATSLGLTAFSANGRVHPHGRPATVHFEYGTTISYGMRTAARPLGPKLAAHYHERFAKNRSGWAGGSGPDLSYKRTGGADGDGDGYVKFKEPSYDDPNHIDGIGTVHLVGYMYSGRFMREVTAAWGGGDPDLRDAKVGLAVRGKKWEPNGTELVWWSQVDLARVPGYADTDSFSNWAHTGFSLTDALASGQWEHRELRLWNDTTDWSYAGANASQGRAAYAYASLDDVLGHLNTDVFNMLTHVDTSEYPTGEIDFDDFEVTYRNHSLLLPSNGGRLVAHPEGSDDDPAALTDGWRHGEGRMWKSGPSPVAPLSFEYAFDAPVTIERIQIHQHPTYPSRNLEVYASADGETYKRVARAKLRKTHSAGPNFAYWLKIGMSAPAVKVKVVVTSGYQPEHWGLGEIEMFGGGATMQTDDDWYRVNADITGLVPGQTYHYRLVSVSEDGTREGADQTFRVPTDATPEAQTGAARVVTSNLVFEGRLNSLGAEASYFFEWGPSPEYGNQTAPTRTGAEITPRSVRARIPAVASGEAVHYRLVVEGGAGRTYGDDALFVTP